MLSCPDFKLWFQLQWLTSKTEIDSWALIKISKRWWIASLSSTHQQWAILSVTTQERILVIWKICPLDRGKLVQTKFADKVFKLITYENQTKSISIFIAEIKTKICSILYEINIMIYSIFPENKLHHLHTRNACVSHALLWASRSWVLLAQTLKLL